MIWYDNRAREMDFNVRDCGVFGDGQTLTTVSVQAAIDKCSAGGGGTVLLPSGKYLVGTIFLKSNVNLHLATGAELIGSPDINDYNTDDIFAQNMVFTQENVTGAHLIIALEVENVSITGHGMINGNSGAFFEKHMIGDKLAILKKRPGQMVYFCECRKVNVEGVSMINAPYWTLFLHGCEDVVVHGLLIDNPPSTRNGDGIDIDCCRNVVASGCIIRSGDDSITLRGNSAPLRDKTRKCENVTVSNCVLSTPCNAIRVGVGNSVIRNCVFSNIVISDTRNGICIVSQYPGLNAGPSIENIRFDNIVMKTVMPFYIAVGQDGKLSVENIYFRGISATGCKGASIKGEPGNPLRNIHFSDIDLVFSGGREHIAATPEERLRIRYEWDKCQPAGFYIQNTDGIEFRNLSLRWKDIDGAWEQAVLTENVTGLTLDRCTLRQPSQKG
jgi:polygalacturonase